MMLVDKDIKVFLSNGKSKNFNETSIVNGAESRISTIGYDLQTKEFYRNGKILKECALQPGESVFAGSEETIVFDKFTVGHIVLRNSRIRMGLSLESPIYHPGHKTRIYYRLTNISSNAIKLSAGNGYASINFEQLENEPEKPYNGAFQEEFDFHGLGEYSSEYADQIKSLDGKIRNLESLEKSIYGNVITIITVFIAIFTILNVNISLAKGINTARTYVMFNLSTIGAVSVLALLLNYLINKENQGKGGLWIIPLLCFVALFAMLFV